MPITLNGDAGITTPSYGGTNAAEYLVPVTAFKNRIINGAMGIWQRGTSYALTNGYAYGSADRWSFIQVTSANGIANQIASGLAGFQYALKVGRNSGATQTNQILMLQAMETNNSIDLAGQSVTLSFYAKAGANFSGTTFKAVVARGTGTDQSVATLGGGSWTGYTETQTSFSLTTSWVRYTTTVSIPSNATQVGIYFTYTPVGTAGADDNFYITGVQLEKGSTATSFDYRPYGTELALCQRYYQKLGTASNAASGGEISICYGQNSGVRTNGNFGLVYSTMRAAPTITINALDVTDNVSYQTTVSGINAQRSGIDRAFLNLTFSSATGTAFDPMNLSTRNSTGFVDLNSEL
jgi:hypothetical protein